MFTGIIECLGTVTKVTEQGGNRNFCVKSPISQELKVDQSVAHNGVCLTVTRVDADCHWVTAIDETLKKSTLGELKSGSVLNLERCMVVNGRFDGHIVQGHVDQQGTIKSIQEANGSWLFEISYDSSLGNVTVEKGSVCVNGVSLTCFNSRKGGFTVAIIPYTYTHTALNQLKAADRVNLEFDIIGKYVKALMNP